MPVATTGGGSTGGVAGRDAGTTSVACASDRPDSGRPATCGADARARVEAQGSGGRGVARA